ncbi:hypothetical protein [Variovorax sp. GT1P44]|uniref:hypothetical protein n=1 Tax=Variovorax sp. GT1P44 TaxID=3443742 RepID=UPI003F47D96E
MNSVVLSAKLRVEARLGRRRLLQFGESGRRIGETHHKAVLTDHEVSLLLELREEGKTYGWLAEKFEISKMTVRSICRGRTRGMAPVRVVLEVCGA